MNYVILIYVLGLADWRWCMANAQTGMPLGFVRQAAKIASFHSTTSVKFRGWQRLASVMGVRGESPSANSLRKTYPWTLRTKHILGEYNNCNKGWRRKKTNKHGGRARGAKKMLLGQRGTRRRWWAACCRM